MSKYTPEEVEKLKSILRRKRALDKSKEDAKGIPKELRRGIGWTGAVGLGGPGRLLSLGWTGAHDLDKIPKGELALAKEELAIHKGKSPHDQRNAVRWVEMTSFMKEAQWGGFSDEMSKIAEKATVYIFKDPISYKDRHKTRTAVRAGIGKVEPTVRAGKGIGAGAGAGLGAAGGAALGYMASGKALPAVLGALTGAAAGGTGGYFGGRALGQRRALKNLKQHGIHAVRVDDTPELRRVLRPALQRKGLDVVIQKKTPYKGEKLEGLKKQILGRVGYPDPHVLKSIGLPTLK